MRSTPTASPAPRPPARTAAGTWTGELSGGLTGAVVSLAFALSFGLLAFAPLGAAHAGIGVVAGFASAIYGQMVAGVVGGTVHPGSTPRASACLILSGLVASLVADPALAPSAVQGPERVVAVAGACVVLSGLIQLVIAWFRMAELSRYVPFPFIAGFMCGIAALIIIAQLWPLAGVDPAVADDLAALLDGFQPATFGVGLATVLVMAVAERIPKIPSALVGLVFGSALYYAFHELAPSEPLGALIGPIPATLPTPTMLVPLLGIPDDALLRVLPSVAVTALLLAVIGTLDTLVGAVAVDQATDGRHNPRRETFAHGIANIASGMCGGAPVVYSPARALASWNAGGRTWATLAIAVGAVTAMLLAGDRLVAAIPLVALAAVIVVNSFGLIDRWVKGLVARLPTDARRGDPWRVLSIATVFIVAAITVAAGFVPALITGLVLSAMLTMIEMNRSLVRRILVGTLRPSRRAWGPTDLQHVEDARARARVVELEGSVFFGSAERLVQQVEMLPTGVDVVVLDCRRVTHIDATGALLLERLTRRMDKRGTTVVLAGVSPGGRLGTLLRTHNAFNEDADRHWASDVDKAMERAEREALKRAGRTATAELRLADFPLFAGLSPTEVAIVESKLQHDVVEPARVLFREGDPGNCVYLLTRGAIEISLVGTEGRRHRIVTMSAGALFGEAAMLDGRPRSATAVAVEASAFYTLSGAVLDDLAEHHAQLSIKLFRNLAREMSRRMRDTDKILRGLDDSLG